MGLPPGVAVMASRAPLAAAAAVVVGGGLAMWMSFGSRVFTSLEWLGTTPTWEVVSVLVSLAVFAYGLRHAPRAKAYAWVLPVALVPPVLFGMLLTSMDLHVRYGTPVEDCRSELDDEGSCSGRDWTFMQGRQRIARATGRLGREACDAFTSSVAASLESRADARTEDGWVRCTLDQPLQWAERPCADVALPEMARCFECGGTSDTNDHYTWLLAIDASCEQASYSHAVNMGWVTAANCLMDTTQRDVCDGRMGVNPSRQLD